MKGLIEYIRSVWLFSAFGSKKRLRVLLQLSYGCWYRGINLKFLFIFVSLEYGLSVKALINFLIFTFKCM